jgi:hypothetical protein
MRKTFAYSIAFLALAVGSYDDLKAQSSYPDAVAVESTDLNSIVEEWKAWQLEPNQDNAFIGEFLDEYTVPQSGQNGLNKMETWYWWASNHPQAIADYLERRAAAWPEEE